jgi:GNAT superfamily N-acetyltransferase
MAEIEFNPDSAAEKNSVSYVLTPEEATRITNDILDESVDKVGPEHRYVVMELEKGDPRANLARQIERTVFEDEFGNDATEMVDMYGPYESASRFFISVDRQKRQATSALRVIENSPAGLMSLHDAAQPPFNVDVDRALAEYAISNLDEVWDVGTVATMPEYRGGGAGTQLFRAMYKAAYENHGIKHMVAIIDKPALGLLKFLRVPLKPFGGAKPGEYYGSKESLPVYGYLPDFYPTMNRYRFIRFGKAARAADVLVYGSRDESMILQGPLEKH